MTWAILGGGAGPNHNRLPFCVTGLHNLCYRHYPADQDFQCCCFWTLGVRFAHFCWLPRHRQGAWRSLEYNAVFEGRLADIMAAVNIEKRMRENAR